MATIMSLFFALALTTGALVLTLNIKKLRQTAKEQKELVQRNLSAKDDLLHECKKSLEESNAMLTNTKADLTEYIKKTKAAQAETQAAKLELEKNKGKDAELAALKTQLQQAEEREKTVKAQLKEAKDALAKFAKEEEERKAKEVAKKADAEATKAEAAKAKAAKAKAANAG